MKEPRWEHDLCKNNESHSKDDFLGICSLLGICTP